MKKFWIGLMGMTAMLIVVPETMAGPPKGHHGEHNEGLALAAGIVHLVKEIITPPRPVVVAPQPAPVVVAPQPAPIVMAPPARPVVIVPHGRPHGPKPPVHAPHGGGHKGPGRRHGR